MAAGLKKPAAERNDYGQAEKPKIMEDQLGGRVALLNPKQTQPLQPSLPNTEDTAKDAEDDWEILTDPDEQCWSVVTHKAMRSINDGDLDETPILLGVLKNDWNLVEDADSVKRRMSGARVMIRQDCVTEALLADLSAHAQGHGNTAQDAVQYRNAWRSAFACLKPWIEGRTVRIHSKECLACETHLKITIEIANIVLWHDGTDGSLIKVEARKLMRKPFQKSLETYVLNLPLRQLDKCRLESDKRMRTWEWATGGRRRKKN